ncbi:unnamed protein product [Periconia digitata]|uniref:RelA/SpoT domain-containing protein n=1 Tax=Periconia digitata TaxID=1303443 RepID=A0A9W4UH21_9PLEO|nr:unnamed protein product [Periconia digitata]
MSSGPATRQSPIIRRQNLHNSTCHSMEKQTEDKPLKFHQRSQSTWVSQQETPPVIEHFLERYNQTHYHFLANRAKELIEEELAKPAWSDVHVNVRCRAKEPKSLREKLKLRHTDPHSGTVYETVDDIWDDIHDLAGVRVILYMPSEDQREKITQVIQAIWGNDVQPKYHQGSEDRIKSDERARILNPSERQQMSKKKYRPKHLGYIAVHYRVKMKETQGKKDYYFHNQRDRVEIQVVSALSHAWAEAGHDILYKSYAYGPPTLQEELLLDSLNGIVLSGDLLLEQFHELVMKRTYARFRDSGDFRIFLRELDVLQPQEGSDDVPLEFDAEGVDVLFRFLAKIEKNYPVAVRNAFKDLGFPGNSRLDYVMADGFKPSFDPAKGMKPTICLLRHLLPQYLSDIVSPTVDQSPKQPDETEARPVSLVEQGGIMMSALILLQNCFDRADHTNKFLREQVTMSEEDRRSLDFVLTHCHRQLLWDRDSDGKGYEGKIEGNIKPAWKWFENEARNPRSICGMVFQLAKMGATKEVGYTTLLEQLKIGHIISKNADQVMRDL